MLKLFSKRKEIVQDEPERITYQSKVRCSKDGFYRGMDGTVVEMRYGTRERYVTETTCSGYWKKYATTEYKVRLSDGNEAWMPSQEVTLIRDEKNNNG